MGEIVEWYWKEKMKKIAGTDGPRRPQLNRLIANQAAKSNHTLKKISNSFFLAALLAVAGTVFAQEMGSVPGAQQQYSDALNANIERMQELRQKVKEKQKKCVLCKGEGIVVKTVLCAKCGGDGKIDKQEGVATIGWPCKVCECKGTIAEKRVCPKCRPYDLGKDGGEETNVRAQRSKCPECCGRGYQMQDKECRSCHGKCVVTETVKKASRFNLNDGQTYKRTVKCTRCGGKGHFGVQKKCAKCNGGDSVRKKVPKGQSPRHEVPEIVKYFKYAAEKGNSKGQYALGVMYAAGDGVPQNRSEAVHWFQQAADQGHGGAQFMLGVSYIAGEGIKTDDTLAGKWLQKASASGYDNSQCSRGLALITKRKNLPPVVALKAPSLGSGSRSVSKVTDNDFISFLQRGLETNDSRSSKDFTHFKFDFESYYQWKDPDTTSMKRNAIFKEFISNACNSDLYKEYVVCLFALVPDGVSFVVTDISQRKIKSDWNFMTKKYLGEREAYFVSLKVLTNGCELPGSNGGKWTGNAWQNKECLEYLRRELLLPYRVDLTIPKTFRTEDVETWGKGKVIVSKDWVYCIRLVAAVMKDGGKVREIEDAEIAFPSMNDAMKFFHHDMLSLND